MSASRPRVTVTASSEIASLSGFQRPSGCSGPAAGWRTTVTEQTWLSMGVIAGVGVVFPVATENVAGGAVPLALGADAVHPPAATPSATAVSSVRAGRAAGTLGRHAGIPRMRSGYLRSAPSAAGGTPRRAVGNQVRVVRVVDDARLP